MSTATNHPLPSDPETWEKIRKPFANSIMVDTPLSSLAQDLDVPPWPIASPDETPSAYIYLPYPQALAALSARGLSPAQLGQLIAILEGTTAFDEPFGEMMEEAAVARPEGAIDADSPLFKNLARLKLPDDFPLVLSSLSPGTIELCRIEKVDTLGGFVTFASRLSQSVIVGGDFRDLLNALAQKDELSLSKLLPLRPGTTGLHLPEALALGVRPLSSLARAAILNQPPSISPELRARVERCLTYFKTEHADLRAAAAAGTPRANLLKGLGDPALESTVLALVTPHLPAPPAPPAPVRRSFWQRLFRRA